MCGNEWETQIIKRTARGQGCPTCARQKQNEQQAERIKERIRTEGSFGDKYPELVDEWDYEKNQNTPYDYLAYSQEQVFWICSKCGYQWKSSISSRSAGHGCRQCGRQEGQKTLVRNLIAVKGSLADNNPNLAAEWHPTKNGEMTPQTVMANSNISAWWKCKVCGYEWEASIAGRNTGGGCHRCLAKQQRISLSTPIIGVNDLASQRPDLAAEWHPTKNGNLTPRDVTRSANKKAWWLGTCGHEWEAVIGSRHLGRGCPVCVREFKISYPEKAIFFYLKKYLSEYVVLENYKPSWLHGKEIDIYIEKLRLGIEYDGVAWHKDPTPDNDKDAVCALHGVDLLRIREKGAPPLNSTNIFWVKNCSESEEELTSAILYVFDYIRQNHNIECDIEVDIDANRIAIYSLLEMQKKANSVATLFPDVAAEWHPTKNGHISPEYVSAHTHKEFWWICPKIAEQLTYRQLLILNAIATFQISGVPLKKTAYGSVAGLTNVAIASEVFELYRMSLLSSSSVIFDNAGINPSALSITGYGAHIYNLMELHTLIPDSENIQLMAEITGFLTGIEVCSND